MAMALTFFNCDDDDTSSAQDQTQFSSTDLVSKLVSPIAITSAGGKALWVAEIGTGKGNDGKISYVTADGKIYPAITGFLSAISQEGTPAGLSHLVVRDRTLYILHGAEGKLYKFDFNDFTPGKSSSVEASKLPMENIGQFVKDYAFKVDNNETNLYNLAWGFDDDLFITDAAANAIIRRRPDGDLSVFYQFAQMTNASSMPDKIDFVPTGIVYDGQKLLVTSLTGFPFIDGKAVIWQIDPAGQGSSYKESFTTLVDVVLTPSKKPLVLQLAKFSLTGTPPGFVSQTGKIVNEDGAILLDHLAMPTDLERINNNMYYVVSMAEGKIIKLTY